jgi:hypothetical protein
MTKEHSRCASPSAALRPSRSTREARCRGTAKPPAAATIGPTCPGCGTVAARLPSTPNSALASSDPAAAATNWTMTCGRPLPSRFDGERAETQRSLRASGGGRVHYGLGNNGRPVREGVHEPGPKLRARSRPWRSDDVVGLRARTCRGRHFRGHCCAHSSRPRPGARIQSPLLPVVRQIPDQDSWTLWLRCNRNSEVVPRIAKFLVLLTS